MNQLIENLKHLPSTIVALCLAFVAMIQSPDIQQLVQISPHLTALLTKISLWCTAAGSAVLIGQKTFAAVKNAGAAANQAKKATAILLYLLIIPIATSQVDCSKNANPKPPTAQDVLAQAAKAIEAISIAANDVTKAVLQAMPDPTDQRAQILVIIQKIVLADQHAKNVVVILQGQQITTPAQIANAVIPILKEIRTAIDDGILGIKNADTKKQAEAWLDAVAIAVTSIQGILEVYHGTS